MCGGGGGLIGAIINVVAVVYPPLQPVAQAYNYAMAADSLSKGDIVGAAMHGYGGYAQGAAADLADFGAGGFGGLDAAAASSGIGSLSSLGDTLYEKANDLVWGNESPFGFDSGVSTNAWDMGEVVGQSVAGGADPAGLMDRISEATTADQLRATAPEALNAARFEGITSGSGLEGSTNYLKDLYEGKNVTLDNMIKQLTPNTEGGYNAAIDTYNTMGQAPMLQSTTPVQLQDMGQGFGTLNNVGTDTLSMPSSFDTNSINGLDFGAEPTMTNIKGMEMPKAVDLSNSSSMTDDVAAGYADMEGAQGVANSGDLSQGGAVPEPKASSGGFNMGNIYDKIMKSQQMSPMQMGLRAAGGLDSYLQNKDAESKLNQMYERAMQTSDPFQGDRALASQKWQEQVNDPSAGWDSYSQGIMPEMQAANAKLAKAGRRSQMPMQLSLAKQNYMANAKNRLAAYNPNQFGAGSSSAVSSAFAPAMASMASNRNAPLFNAGTDILRSMRLSDIYG